MMVALLVIVSRSAYRLRPLLAWTRSTIVGALFAVSVRFAIVEPSTHMLHPRPVF
jgi:hypothetical protein